MLPALANDSYVNGWSDWVDESLFLAGLLQSASSATPCRTAEYSVYLHVVVLSIAMLNAPAYDSTRMVPDQKSMSEVLADHAAQMMASEFESPMTTTARATMLLGSCLFYNLHRDRGWLYVVQGARIAQLRE